METKPRASAGCSRTLGFWKKLVGKGAQPVSHQRSQLRIQLDRIDPLGTQCQGLLYRSPTARAKHQDPARLWGPVVGQRRSHLAEMCCTGCWIPGGDRRHGAGIDVQAQLRRRTNRGQQAEPRSVAQRHTLVSDNGQQSEWAAVLLEHFSPCSTQRLAERFVG
ncbi:MAG: hypothetical protein Ct9H300mP16_04110 [Pseudomonadota bacterium]|nr:MAG: hypothetical protein Ct9H300mP16_04110 [Pseudomonadota bacterium]